MPENLFENKGCGYYVVTVTVLLLALFCVFLLFGIVTGG